MSQHATGASWPGRGNASLRVLVGTIAQRTITLDRLVCEASPSAPLLDQVITPSSLHDRLVDLVRDLALAQQSLDQVSRDPSVDDLTRDGLRQVQDQARTDAQGRVSEADAKLAAAEAQLAQAQASWTQAKWDREAMATLHKRELIAAGQLSQQQTSALKS